MFCTLTLPLIWMYEYTSGEVSVYAVGNAATYSDTEPVTTVGVNTDAASVDAFRIAGMLGSLVPLNWNDPL